VESVDLGLQGCCLTVYGSRLLSCLNQVCIESVNFPKRVLVSLSLLLQKGGLFFFFFSLVINELAFVISIYLLLNFLCYLRESLLQCISLQCQLVQLVVRLHQLGILFFFQIAH